MKKIAIFCANGLEECEALVVVDLLRRAKLEVDMISLEDTINIHSSHGISFKADKLIKDINHHSYDALILPGGLAGTKTLSQNQTLISYLHEFKDNNKLIAAICAAPSIFIDNKLVDEGKFSVYPDFEHGLKTSSLKVTVDNNVITGQGLGVVFEFAYEIIKYLVDEGLAKKVLDEIQY